MPEFQQGELDNGVDDNGNGLIDETGLAFAFDGDVCTILLVMASTNGENSTQLESTAIVTVLIRN